MAMRKASNRDPPPSTTTKYSAVLFNLVGTDVATQLVAVGLQSATQLQHLQILTGFDRLTKADFTNIRIYGSSNKNTHMRKKNTHTRVKFLLLGLFYIAVR